MDKGGAEQPPPPFGDEGTTPEHPPLMGVDFVREMSNRQPTNADLNLAVGILDDAVALIDRANALLGGWNDHLMSIRELLYEEASEVALRVK